jgi:hypothetical protein
VEHDGTFSLITKENRYVGVGSYCGSCPSNACRASRRATTSRSSVPSLEREWQYKATNTESCARQEDDTVECVDDHPETLSGV